MDKLSQLAVVFASLAWIGQIVKSVFDRKRLGAQANLDEAKAADVVAGTATALLTPLRARVAELQDEVNALRLALRNTTEEADILRRSLHEANEQLLINTAENERINAENRQLRLRLHNGSSG